MELKGVLSADGVTGPFDVVALVEARSLVERRKCMTTADAVREKAFTLAGSGSPTEEAIRELLETCKQKRVPVVLARQQFLKDLEASSSDPVVTRAAELLDGVLERLPLA